MWMVQRAYFCHAGYQAEDDAKAEQCAPILAIAKPGVNDTFKRELRPLLVHLVRDVYSDRLTAIKKLRVLLAGDGRRTGKKRRNFLVVIGILDIGLGIGRARADAHVQSSARLFLNGGERRTPGRALGDPQSPCRGPAE